VLQKALGSTDPHFVDGILKQLVHANLDANGESVSGSDLNFAAAVINGVEPRDQLEAMLAAQMASVHSATMKMAQQIALSETYSAQDSAERAFNKLARTFISQMEVLKRYRTSGEQTVTVQHVNVTDGGQAIVGNVTQGTRDGVPPAKPRALAPPIEEPMKILANASPDPFPVKRKSRK
jgi:hypothetical protein